VTSTPDVFHSFRWPVEMSHNDEDEIEMLLECAGRPFVLFDIDTLAQEYSDADNPLPGGWDSSKLRPPFPATVFRYRHDRESYVYAAFHETEEMIECWVVWRFIHQSFGGHHYGHYFGCGRLYPGKQWQWFPSDFTESEIKSERNAKLWVNASATIPFLAMYLLSCKNIKADRVKPSRQSRRLAQRKGDDSSREYRIVVKVPGNKSFTIAGPRRKGDPVISPHMVRGHFAEYSTDKPLFGKYVGRFWKPAHVRGLQDNDDATPEARDYLVIPERPAA
jgi:hypothetical protein